MNILFLVFHGFDPANGISKKIHYQYQALKECNSEVHLCNYEINELGHSTWKIENKTLIDLGKGIPAKIKSKIYFSPIIDYIKSNNINFVYIRSYHNANPFTIHFINRIRRNGTQTVMEIPTYPYDQEYITLRMKLDLMIDKIFRKRLALSLNKIVTFSNESIIFGQQTIRISNGIDFSSIKLKEKNNNTSQSLHLIGVAEVHYWHGFDRIIKGLANYYRENPSYIVYFHIVGNLSGEREKKEIVNPIEEFHLEKYIFLHGNKHGKELDSFFEKADLGIGSLGRHRSGITHIKTLKNREYAARGIPFIYSENDEDFDKKEYVLKAQANETPIDINEIIEFYNSKNWSPSKIRESIRNLSWKEQMQKVLNEVY